MMTYVAKPGVFNSLNSKEFSSVLAAKLYLDEFTGYKMPVDDWCVLGKISEVDKNGQPLSIVVDTDFYL